MQNSLLDLQAKKTREETLIELELKELQDMKNKTELILINAQNLFN
jgi:hypothetical protein